MSISGEVYCILEKIFWFFSFPVVNMLSQMYSRRQIYSWSILYAHARLGSRLGLSPLPRRNPRLPPNYRKFVFLGLYSRLARYLNVKTSVVMIVVEKIAVLSFSLTKILNHVLSKCVDPKFMYWPIILGSPTLGHAQILLSRPIRLIFYVWRLKTHA